MSRKALTVQGAEVIKAVSLGMWDVRRFKVSLQNLASEVENTMGVDVEWVDSAGTRCAVKHYFHLSDVQDEAAVERLANFILNSVRNFHA